MKNEKIRKDLINLYNIASSKTNEFTFFKVEEYTNRIIEYIEKLESKIETYEIKEVLEYDK